MNSNNVGWARAAVVSFAVLIGATGICIEQSRVVEAAHIYDRRAELVSALQRLQAQMAVGTNAINFQSGLTDLVAADSIVEPDLTEAERSKLEHFLGDAKKLSTFWRFTIGSDPYTIDAFRDMIDMKAVEKNQVMNVIDGTTKLAAQEEIYHASHYGATPPGIRSSQDFRREFNESVIVKALTLLGAEAPVIKA